MKKTIILFFCLLIILVACNNREVDTPSIESSDGAGVINENDYDNTVTMNWVTLNEIDDLENIREFDLGADTDRHLVITIGGPVSELRLITIEHIDENSFIETSNLFNFGVLASYQPLVLHGYSHVGTLPVWAITFIDNTGEERHYLFQQSQADGTLHYRAFDLLEDDTMANNLAPLAVSPYRPLTILGHTDVSYPHPFGNEDSNVTFLLDGSGGTLVIDINETVRNLQFVPVLFIERETGVYIFDFLVDTPFSQAPEMLDHQYLMIHNWTNTAATTFNQGLIFTDIDGNERTFVFGIDNQQNGGIVFHEVVDGSTVMQRAQQ